LVAQANQLTVKTNQQAILISTLTSQLSSTQEDLDNANAELLTTQQELDQLQDELENTSVSLEEAEAEFEELKAEVEAVENSINESMAWFEDNAQLSGALGSFDNYLQSKCVDSDQLNLACIEHFMRWEYGFHYINERKDRLFTLEEMVARHGGDCEDYSLFLKAVLNSYKEMDPGVELLAWTPSGNEFIIYETSTRYWYYDGDPVVLGSLDDLYLVSFCYVMSYSQTSLLGHCVVALAEQEIKSVDDIDALDGASVFEPQNGEYLGEIGEDFNLCTGDSDCGTSDGDLIIVITNNDFYKIEDGEWQGFSTALESIEEFMAELENMTD
jgi:hypothetical protein